MADFSINADLILQPAKNVNQVAQQTAQQFNSAFQSALGSSSGANKAADDLAKLRKQTQDLANSLLGVQAGSKQTKNVLDDIGIASTKVTGNVKNAAGAIENFGRQSALAIRRYAAFVLAARGVFSLGKDIDRSINEAISFNRELVKLAQIGNQSISSLRGVNDEITKLSTTFGTSSEDLIKVEVSLRRMGLSATDAKKVLEGLAEASLSASFEDIKSAAEGTTAVMNEFGIRANQVKDILGSMNAVANKFGTSFEDIFTAVKKSGEVFSQAGGGLNSPIEKFQQFLAIFATAKSTTQEGANSIASSLKILTGKLVQQSTIDTLRQYNIELTDLKGNFVGDYEALRRLSEGLNRLGRGSVSLFKAADLGGYEQLNKVLPLLVNFDKASEAYKTAQQGAGSVSKDAAIAQQALAVQMAKVREEFNALIRNLGQSETFKAIAKLALDTASAFIKLVDSIKELVPLLALIGAVKLVQYAPTFARGFRDTLINNVRPSFNAPPGKTEGGLIPGFGGGDSVPIMAERGEFIINKDAARKIGYRRLNQLNVRGYARGGKVPEGFQETSGSKEAKQQADFDKQTQSILASAKTLAEGLKKGAELLKTTSQIATPSGRPVGAGYSTILGGSVGTFGNFVHTDATVAAQAQIATTLPSGYLAGRSRSKAYIPSRIAARKALTEQLASDRANQASIFEDLKQEAFEPRTLEVGGLGLGGLENYPGGKTRRQRVISPGLPRPGSIFQGSQYGAARLFKPQLLGLPAPFEQPTGPYGPFEGGGLPQKPNFTLGAASTTPVTSSAQAFKLFNQLTGNNATGKGRLLGAETQEQSNAVLFARQRAGTDLGYFKGYTFARGGAEGRTALIRRDLEGNDLQATLAHELAHTTGLDTRTSLFSKEEIAASGQGYLATVRNPARRAKVANDPELLRREGVARLVGERVRQNPALINTYFPSQQTKAYAASAFSSENLIAETAADRQAITSFNEASENGPVEAGIGGIPSGRYLLGSKFPTHKTGLSGRRNRFNLGSQFPTFKKFFNKPPNIPPNVPPNIPPTGGVVTTSDLVNDFGGPPGGPPVPPGGPPGGPPVPPGGPPGGPPVPPGSPHVPPGGSNPPPGGGRFSRFKGIGYGALIAADIVAPQIANAIGRESPTKAGIGGGITGAASGATVGALFGPYGIAIGTAVGAVNGFTENFKQAQLDTAFKNLGKSTEDLNATIERYSKGFSTERDVVSSFRQANVQSTDVAKTIAGQAGPGATSSYITSIKEGGLDLAGQGLGHFLFGGDNKDQASSIRDYQRAREQAGEAGQKVFDASGDQRAAVTNFLTAGQAKGVFSSDLIARARTQGLDDRTLALAGKGGKGIAVEEQKILQSGKDAARQQYELARLYEYGAEATKKEYEANDEAIRKQNALAEAIKLADNGVSALVYSLDKLGHAAERANVVGQAGGARAETAFGQAINPGQFALGKTGPLFSAISNSTAFSPEQVQTSLGQLQRSLGVGPEFGAGLLQGRQVREVLPGILEKYSGKGVDEASTGITKDIEGLDLGKELTTKLVSEVRARLPNGAGPDAVKNLVNDKAFTENIGGNIDKAYEDNFKKFVAGLNAAQDQYKAGLEKYYSAELDIEKKKLDTEEQTFKYGLERSKLANPLHFIGPDEARVGLLQRVGSLTGGATTAAGITANLSPLVAQRADVQRQLGNNGLTQEERTKLIDQEAQLTLSINKNTTGLELLAKSTDGLAQINEAYNRIQEQRQVGKGLISTFLNASPEQALQLRRGFAGVHELEGGRTNFGIQQLRDIRSALDVSLPAYAASQNEGTRKKGAELEAKFNQIVAQNAGINLNSNNPLAEAIKTSTSAQGQSPAERVLIAKFDEFTKAQTDAQKAITDFSKQNLAEPLNIIKTTLQEQLIILRAEAIKNGVPLPGGQGRAMGGLLPGFGGGDRIPIMAEAGEFVINKHSTAANLDLLQEINQGYAIGGRVRRRKRNNFNGYSFPDLVDLKDRTIHDYAISYGPNGKKRSVNYYEYEKRNRAIIGSLTPYWNRHADRNEANLPFQRLDDLEYKKNGFNFKPDFVPNTPHVKNNLRVRPFGFANGGLVRGYAAGGQVTGYTGGGGEAFIQSMTRFENAINKLAQIHIPETIQMTATHSVDVVINGAAVFAQMKPEIADMILGYVKDEMRRYINPVTGETEEHQQYNYGGGG